MPTGIMNAGIFYLVLNIIIMLAYYGSNKTEGSGLFGFIVMFLFGAPLVIFATLIIFQEELKDQRAGKRRTTEEKVDAIIYNFKSKKDKKHDGRTAK